MSGIFSGTGSRRVKIRRPWRGPMQGLGAISDSLARQYADAMKDCANAKSAKVGYQAVAPGVPGPGTCWLANTVYSDGCPGKAQVAQFCVDKGIAGRAPAKVSQATLRAATPVAEEAVARTSTQRLAATASQYPWGTVSSSTKSLQQEVNAFGQKMVASGKWGSYCKIAEDGKLGSGTCGALRAAGMATPTTCQSFATDCRGTITGPGVSTSRTTTVTQPARTFTTPEPSPVIEEESWLDRIGGLPALIMGGAVLAALGVVGVAVAKKKGLIGKKPKPNRRRRRVRRNSGLRLDDMKHEGMAAADWSLRRGRGVSPRERGRAWLQQSANLADRHPELLDDRRFELAFKEGWDLRAKAVGYATA